MRRSLTPSLIVVLVLQLALALVLFMRRDPLAGTRSDTPLVRPRERQRGRWIRSSHRAVSRPESTRIVLKKKEGTWVLPDAYDAPAESARVSSLLDRLVALKRGLPIATSEVSAAPFQGGRWRFRAPPGAERALLAGSVTVYFGSSPGLRKSDARAPPTIAACTRSICPRTGLPTASARGSTRTC